MEAGATPEGVLAICSRSNHICSPELGAAVLRSWGRASSPLLFWGTGADAAVAVATGAAVEPVVAGVTRAPPGGVTAATGETPAALLTRGAGGLLPAPGWAAPAAVAATGATRATRRTLDAAGLLPGPT